MKRTTHHRQRKTLGYSHEQGFQSVELNIWAFGSKCLPVTLNSKISFTVWNNSVPKCEQQSRHANAKPWQSPLPGMHFFQTVYPNHRQNYHSPTTTTQPNHNP